MYLISSESKAASPDGKMTRGQSSAQPPGPTSLKEPLVESVADREVVHLVGNWLRPGRLLRNSALGLRNFGDP